MTLLESLKALSYNTEYNISVMDVDGANVIVLNPEGYSALKDDLAAKEVEKILIADAVHVIKIYLRESNSGNTTDPTDPTDPSDPGTGGGG